METPQPIQKFIKNIKVTVASVPLAVKIGLVLIVVVGVGGLAALLLLQPKQASTSNTAIFLYTVENGYSMQRYNLDPLVYPTVMYDDGLLVCGSPHVSGMPRAKTLSQKEVKQFFEGAETSGLSSLENKVYEADSSDYLDPAGLGTTIYAYRNDTALEATHRSGPTPDAFGSVNQYVQSYCDNQVEEVFQPAEYVAESVKLKDAENATDQYEVIEVDAAFAEQLLLLDAAEEAQSRIISSDVATAAKQRMSGDTAILKLEDASYLVRISPRLNPYELKNEQHSDTQGATDSHQDSDVLAAATPGVEFIWVYASNQSKAGNAESLLNTTSRRILDWYMSKTQKALKFSGSRVYKSPNTIAALETCPASKDCKGDKPLAAFYNLQNEIYGDLTGRQVLVFYQGTETAVCKGWALPNSGGYGGANQDSAGTSNGGFGLLNATACNWQDARERVGGHELGHALGSSHWCQDRNIMAGGNCAVQKASSLRVSSMNGTQKNAFLGSNFFKKAPDMLRPGQRLYTGAEIYSADGSYKLVVQPTDGNVVVYRVADGKVMWTSTTGNAGAPHAQLDFQKDGNFIVSTEWGPYCHSWPKPGANRLVMQKDGNLVIYDGAGAAKWSTTFPVSNHYWTCVY